MVKVNALPVALVVARFPEGLFIHSVKFISRVVSAAKACSQYNDVTSLYVVPSSSWNIEKSTDASGWLFTMMV